MSKVDLVEKLVDLTDDFGVWRTNELSDKQTVQLKELLHKATKKELESALQSFFIRHRDAMRMVFDLWETLPKKTRKSIAANAGKKRAEKAPKATYKSLIKEHWLAWKSLENYKELYAGNASFASAMMDKYYNPTNKTTPQSQPVIERWCRNWEKEQKNNAPS